MITKFDPKNVLEMASLRFCFFYPVLDESGNTVSVNAVFENCHGELTLPLSSIGATIDDGYDDEEEIPNEFEVNDKEEFDSDK
jgi:hypothetical protein